VKVALYKGNRIRMALLLLCAQKFLVSIPTDCADPFAPICADSTQCKAASGTVGK